LRHGAISWLHCENDNIRSAAMIAIHRRGNLFVDCAGLRHLARLALGAAGPWVLLRAAGSWTMMMMRKRPQGRP